MVLHTDNHICVNCQKKFDNLQSYIDHKKLYDWHICLDCNANIDGLKKYVQHKTRQCQQCNTDSESRSQHQHSVKGGSEINSEHHHHQRQKVKGSKRKVNEEIGRFEGRKGKVRRVKGCMDNSDVRGKVLKENSKVIYETKKIRQSDGSVVKTITGKVVTIADVVIKEEIIHTNDEGNDGQAGNDTNVGNDDAGNARHAEDAGAEQYGSDNENDVDYDCTDDKDDDPDFTMGSEKEVQFQLEGQPHSKTKHVQRERHIKFENACRLCSVKFVDESDLSLHFDSAEHMKKVANCDSSQLLNDDFQATLLRSMPFQCEICKFFCVSVADMESHVNSQDHETAVGRTVGVLMCEKCEQTCETSEKLLMHLRSGNHAEHSNKNHTSNISDKSSPPEISDKSPTPDISDKSSTPDISDKSSTLNISDKSSPPDKADKNPTPCVVKEMPSSIKCRQCDFYIMNVDKFVLHLMSEHEDEDVRGSEAQLRCPFCDTSKMARYMSRHIGACHVNKRVYKCTLCQFVVKASTSLNKHFTGEDHMKAIGEKIKGAVPLSYYGFRLKQKDQIYHGCDYCNYSTPTFADLKKHFESKHKQDTFECLICEVRFDEEELYHQHKSSEFHIKAEHGRERYSCRHCQWSFTSAKRRDFHELTHTEIITEKAGFETDPFFGIDPKFHDFVTSIKRVKLQEKVVCPQCDRSMKKIAIKRHLRCHSDIRAFKCFACSYTSKNSDTMRVHVMVKHCVVRDHKCEFCDMAFKKKETLRDHLASKHEQVSPMCKRCICDICGHEFMGTQKLNHHMKNVHSERTIECPIKGCFYKFSRPGGLKQHLKVHNDARPYLCDLCGYSAKKNKTLIVHKRTHQQEKRFSCQYCDYKTHENARLIQHLRSHAGVKPFSCPYCQYCSTTLSNIHKHVQESAKHKMYNLPIYPCGLCDPSNREGFHRNKDFIQHLMTVHGISQKDASNNNIAQFAGIYKPEHDIKGDNNKEIINPIQVKKSKPRACVPDEKMAKALEDLADAVSSKLQNIEGEPQPVVQTLTETDAVPAAVNSDNTEPEYLTMVGDVGQYQVAFNGVDQPPQVVIAYQTDLETQTAASYIYQQ